MTILQKNLKRLFKENSLSLAALSRSFGECDQGITASGIGQWIQDVKPTVPTVERLVILANLLNTTIEELTENPRCKSGAAVSLALNFTTLKKVIEVLENDKTLSYAYDCATTHQRAYIFKLLYSLSEDIDIEQLAGSELLGMMDVSTGEKNAKKPAKKRVIKSVKKRRH